MASRRSRAWNVLWRLRPSWRKCCHAPNCLLVSKNGKKTDMSLNICRFGVSGLLRCKKASDFWLYNSFFQCAFAPLFLCCYIFAIGLFVVTCLWINMQYFRQKNRMETKLYKPCEHLSSFLHKIGASNWEENTPTTQNCRRNVLAGSVIV